MRINLNKMTFVWGARLVKSFEIFVFYPNYSNPPTKIKFLSKY